MPLPTENELSLTWQVSPDLLGVLNADGYFERSNPAWYKTLGWSREELRQTKFFDLLHPDDLERNYNAFEEIKLGQPVLSFENRYRHKQGGYRWLSWVAVPEGGKFYCSARDITAEKKQAEELMARTAERDTAWRLSQDLLVITRENGILDAVNTAWTALLGWREEELVGKPFTSILHPDEAEKTLQVFEGMLKEPLITPYEHRLRHKDGGYRWFAWTGAFENGKVYASGRDTTLERENAATLASERTDSRLREQFIAVLGHDLRNPLASIDGAIRILRREQHSEKATQVLTLMKGSVLRMSSLIDNVLDFARGRLGGGITLVCDADEALQPVLEQVVDELKLGSPGHIIETDFHLDEPVSCDRTRIGQMASNLLGNALMHGAEDAPVTICATSGGGSFELSVSNGGDPIPEKAMAYLFHPFFRGEVRESQQGLGLGLHIASEIAKAHGGALTVDSKPGLTRFTFRMPL